MDLKPAGTSSMFHDGTSSKTNMNKLQILQNRLLKFLFNKPLLYPTNQLHNEIIILKIKNLFDFSVSLFVHDCLQGKVPEPLSNYFKYKVTRYPQRQGQIGKLDIPKSRISIGQARVKSIGATIWNKIDLSISSVNDKNKFKVALLEIL